MTPRVYLPPVYYGITFHTITNSSRVHINLMLLFKLLITVNGNPLIRYVNYPIVGEFYINLIDAMV